MKKRNQIFTLLLTVAFFVAFNLSLYGLFTRRLSNNFSGATRAQMIDVGCFLPHAEGSELPKIDTSFTLGGDLPVLDGAAALVPVYAAVINNIYPEDCVTFEGGAFSDDNFYGENFANDSAMQYNNTVRGYQAIVDGTTDIFFSAAPTVAHISLPPFCQRQSRRHGAYGSLYLHTSPTGGNLPPLPASRLTEHGGLVIGRNDLQKIPFVAAAVQAGASFRVFDQLELGRLYLEGVHVLLRVDLPGVK